MQGTVSIKDSPIVKKSPCLWMQADIVPLKMCDRDYSCTSCKYDRIMQQVADENQKLLLAGMKPEGKRGKIVSWKDKLKGMPAARRPCIHHLKQRIEFRTCTHEYRCSACDFDQFFDDQFSVRAMLNPVGYMETKGFKFPHGYYIHHGHTWLKLGEGQSVTVGIDEFALSLLGPFDQIKSPLIGKEVKQDRPAIEVTRGKNRAQMLSPVSGVVTSINADVRTDGKFAGNEPYSKGWVMSVHSSRLRKDLKNLMINEETGGFMDEQVGQLYKLVEEVSGPLATDGGHLSDDIFGKIPQLGWNRLTKMFLHT